MTRLQLALPLEVTVAGYAKPSPAMLVDLSESGCRLSARSVFLVGAAIKFSLTTQGSRKLALQGTVRHTVPSAGGGLEYGIEFARLSSADAMTLAGFITEERSRDGAAAAARVETEFPVHCTLVGERNAIPGLALDLGRGGMKLAVDAKIAPDRTVTLRFTLPQDSTALTLQGRVLHCTQRLREHHCGIVFLEPPPQAVERITRFVRAARLRELGKAP